MSKQQIKENETDLPVLPCQALGLCKYAQQALNYISKKSNYASKRYALFLVLLLEIISIPVACNLGIEFKDFWYPFFANNIILILLYKNYCDRKMLRYCQRTIIVLRGVVIYFGFNSFIMITGIKLHGYYNYVSYGLIGISFIILLLTLYKRK